MLEYLSPPLVTIVIISYFIKDQLAVIFLLDLALIISNVSTCLDSIHLILTILMAHQINSLHAMGNVVITNTAARPLAPSSLYFSSKHVSKNWAQRDATLNQIILPTHSKNWAQRDLFLKLAIFGQLSLFTCAAVIRFWRMQPGDDIWLFQNYEFLSANH